MSEHQLTVYIHDIQPEALIAALDVKVSPEDTGSKIQYSAVDRVTLFHVWFPDEALLEKLQGISRAHPMWWVESYSKGIDWDRKWMIVGVSSGVVRVRRGLRRAVHSQRGHGEMGGGTGCSGRPLMLPVSQTLYPLTNAVDDPLHLGRRRWRYGVEHCRARAILHPIAVGNQAMKVQICIQEGAKGLARRSHCWSCSNEKSTSAVRTPSGSYEYDESWISPALFTLGTLRRARL